VPVGILDRLPPAAIVRDKHVYRDRVVIDIEAVAEMVRETFGQKATSVSSLRA
jgi:hypothetical protein